MLNTVLIAQIAATSVMTGVIWMVQLLVYPSFVDVAATADRSTWQVYHARHARRISYIVAPFWATTILVSVSHHAQLSTVAAMHRIHQLIRVNWVRSVAWSMRWCLALYMCVAV